MSGWIIFVLLLVGFVVGVGGTVFVTWIRQRRQRRLDISYRQRNAKKAVGEMPDIEELIKSARIGETDEEKAEASIDSIPGPLHTGSKSCFSVSIEGYSALLRSKHFSLSQAEEVQPVHSRGAIEAETAVQAVAPIHSVELEVTAEPREDDEDPETPWIPTNVNKSFADPRPGEMAEGIEDIDMTKPVSVPRMAPIGEGIGPRGLDASAADILSNPDGRDEDARVRSSFDPPFEKMARASISSIHSIKEDAVVMRPQDCDEKNKVAITDVQSSPLKSPLRNNPFASELADEDRDLIKAEIQAGG